MNNNTFTLQQYIEKVDKGAFVIPSYQRGYVWGQVKSDSKTDSVTNILNSLLDGYKKKKEIFLQGITVCEEGNNVFLVDGQQRTTFLYLLLKYLDYKGNLSINYAVRDESNSFLNNLDIANIIQNGNDENESFQDIFFFKKTILLIDKKLKNEEHKAFQEYILSNVKFLYIPIPDEKATIVFSMMNGNKAQMLQEELIKSELLRSASLQTKDGLISEAENAAIRSRLAREWDSWLYWWNDENRKLYFHIDSQLGWLLPIINNSNEVAFEDFRKKVLETSTIQSAKKAFKRIRLLQKSIEDAYNNPIVYNLIGAILHFRNSRAERFTFLRWYFGSEPNWTKEKALQELTRYYDWSMLNINHEDIVGNNSDRFAEARDDFRAKLEDDLLYIQYYEIAARWLLRLNIAEDCSQNGIGRHFDFDIWRNRSLEHIYAKSKVGHKEDGIALSWDNKTIEDISSITLWREDIKFKDSDTEYSASEHSIGNLVLLYKNDNSKFNDDDFQDKKQIFFSQVGSSIFKSRHLIHTISVFAHSDWTGEIIAEHKKEELNRFDSQFSIYCTLSQD